MLQYETAAKKAQREGLAGRRFDAFRPARGDRLQKRRRRTVTLDADAADQCAVFWRSEPTTIRS